MFQPLRMDTPVPMERLDLGAGWGQNSGFILYRAIVPRFTKIKFTKPALDRAQVGKEFYGRILIYFNLKYAFY